MIMVNKWDLIEKDHKTMDKIKKEMLEKLGENKWIPIIFTSVEEKQRIMQAIELAVKVYENKTKKVTTSKLNDIMLQEIEKYPPPAWKGKYIKIKYVTQLPTKNPVFAFFCNLPQYIKGSLTGIWKTDSVKTLILKVFRLRLLIRRNKIRWLPSTLQITLYLFKLDGRRKTEDPGLPEGRDVQ
jgi:predicted GTPase